MENRIRNFVYHNDNVYDSYDSVKCLFFCFVPFLTVIIITAAVVAKLWLCLSILLIIDFTFLLHIILLKYFYKNTYALRFFSDGIVNLLLSGLLLLLAYVAILATESDTAFVNYGTLIIYSIVVVLCIILFSKSSKSPKYEFSSQAPVPKKYSVIIGFLIPCSGTFGILIAKVIFSKFEIENQVTAYIGFAIATIISMVFPLGYVRSFLKYFYCKKYKITCDEKGCYTSPMLFPLKKKKKKRQMSDAGDVISKHTKGEKNQKKRLPWIAKILIGIMCTPIVLFVILFIISFIKTIIENI